MIAVQNELLAEGRRVSWAKLCRWLEVPRSTAYYEPRAKTPPKSLDEGLVGVIRKLIQRYPTFGIRRVWAYLRFRMGCRVNRKKVARILRLKGWTCKQRKKGGRPRVKFKKSIAERPDQRWATDLALVFCGPKDGWCVFAPVVDCCTRQVLAWELAPTARAKTAERALEQALLGRFGWTYGAPEGLTIRHDNGLVFGSKLYRSTAREYGLTQEYTAPYTPEDNGLVERFIRSVKEECVWQHRFRSMEHARQKIAAWVKWYNGQRPHQALAYKTPDEVYEELTRGAA